MISLIFLISFCRNNKDSLTQIYGSSVKDGVQEMLAFENTILEKADFRTSFNYSIDPEKDRIKMPELGFNFLSSYFQIRF